MDRGELINSVTRARAIGVAMASAVFVVGLLGGRTSAAESVRSMGPCWHVMGIGDIKLSSIFGLTRAVVRRMPVGKGRETLVEVFMISLPLGVETVMGLGSKYEFVIGQLTWNGEAAESKRNLPFPKSSLSSSYCSSLYTMPNGGCWS